MGGRVPELIRHLHKAAERTTYAVYLVPTSTSEIDWSMDSPMLGQDTLSERCERKVKVILKRQKDRQCLSRFMQEAEPNHHSSSCHPFRPGEWIEMSTITQPIYTTKEVAQRKYHGKELGALKRRCRERYDAARKARDAHRRQRANRGFLKEALQNNEAL